MSGFTGINDFGSLTTQNGVKLTFKDFDKNGDGKISEDEYAQVLNDLKLDTVEFSTIDRDSNHEISENEFKIIEQQQKMQEMVNALAPDIAIDFAGDKSKYIPEITAALRDFIKEFTNDFTGMISEMATMFEQKLPEKYAEITENILANDPDTITTNVLNEIIQELVESETDLPQETLKKISTQLDTVAQSFVNSYAGNNLESDLRIYLEEWLTKSDAEMLKDDVAKYQSRVSKYGATIETKELAGLKSCAKQLLTSALEHGVEVKLGKQKVTLSNLDAVLNKYTDGETLRSDIQAFIDKLSTVNKKDQIITEEAEKTAAEIDKAFAGIKGDECQVNKDTIDYSQIPGYANNEIIDDKLSSSETSYNSPLILYRKSKDILNNQSLKNQMKQQISKMLAAKGIPFSKVESIFENVYNDAINMTLDSFDIRNEDSRLNLTGVYFRRTATNEVSTQRLVNDFIDNFNLSFKVAIDLMNKSNQDLDIEDIDYSVMTPQDDDLVILDDKIYPSSTNKDIDLKDKANGMIDRLKPQMLAKARAMCKANGIEFDNDAFNAIFNNAKNDLVACSVNARYIDLTNLRVGFTREFQEKYTTWVETEKGSPINNPRKATVIESTYIDVNNYRTRYYN